MLPRDLILTTVGSAVLLGIVGGFAVNPHPKPAPQPAWRHAARPDGPSNDSYQIVDSGPQDLSPTWYIDHLPTWKRRALLASAGYTPPTYPDYSSTAIVDEPTDQTVQEDDPDRAAAPADDRDSEAARDTADAARAAMAPSATESVAEQQEQPPSADATSSESHGIDDSQDRDL